LASLPSIAVTDEELRELQHGRTIAGAAGPASELAAVTAGGELVAILAERGPGRLSAVRNFTQPG
jgi:hypothetical protein